MHHGHSFFWVVLHLNVGYQNESIITKRVPITTGVFHLRLCNVLNSRLNPAILMWVRWGFNLKGVINQRVTSRLQNYLTANLSELIWVFSVHIWVDLSPIWVGNWITYFDFFPVKFEFFHCNFSPNNIHFPFLYWTYWSNFVISQTYSTTGPVFRSFGPL